MTKADNTQNFDQTTPPPFGDPFLLGQVLMGVSQKIQPLIQDFFEKYEFDAEDFSKDPLNMRTAYFEFLNKLWADPQKLFEKQMEYWQDWAELYQNSSEFFFTGEKSTDSYAPEKGDRRFKSPLWNDSAFFDFIKQSYLLTSQWMQNIVHETEGLDEETRAKMDFQTKQFVNAIAPTNFVATNPEVLQETLETGGENLVRGLQNLLEDLERGHGKLDISTTDYSAFKLGENIATTPGKVIYQNELMQLIQYKSATKQVHKCPLLIIPPWINKFYILDLKPENSFIKWLVDQGHTVFTISWVNPTRKLAKKRFEDYMSQGILDAMDQVQNVTAEPKCTLVSYCLGGTLLSTTLAYLAAKGEEERVSSATFLTSLIDFEKAGELKMFMDENQLSLMNKEMEEKGFFPADQMKQTFSLLRANDMVWSFVINNYLMGREPFPFDLLYWNDDATNMPAAMHSFYIQKCYGQNRLAQADGVTMNGTPIDMGKVKTPSYFLSTKEDHIAPWMATYQGTQLFQGPTQFTLAASGHVAGVINPPAANKYCYWNGNKAKKYPESPEDWFENSQAHDGSWWPHWQKWAQKYAGEKVPARKIGGGKLKAIEDAPGSYVKTKAS